MTTAFVRQTLEAKAFLITWTGLSSAEPIGEAAEHASSSDRTVQVGGTFGGASIIIEGSNDGTNYIVLTDGQGNAISFTTDGIEAVIEATRYIRPRVSGGSGVSVNVNLYAKG